MTLNEIIEVSKTKKHEEFDIWSMADHLSLDSYSIKNAPKVSLISQCYFIQWYCTDSYVGCSVLFFNDKPVAVTSQQGRKCTLNIEWLDEESYYLVYNYVKSFIKEDQHFDILPQADKLKEWGATYSVEFTDQLIISSKTLFYNNEVVQYVQTGNPKDCIDQTVYIRLPSGEEKLINISELRIQYFDKN